MSSHRLVFEPVPETAAWKSSCLCGGWSMVTADDEMATAFYWMHVRRGNNLDEPAR